VNVLACVFFAAISGSSPATVAAIGSNMIPEMEKVGYSRKFTGALTASSGMIGVMIPPSIPFIIYGVTAEVSNVMMTLSINLLPPSRHQVLGKAFEIQFGRSWCQ